MLGDMLDQAELHGLLQTLYGLNVDLISVTTRCGHDDDVDR